jgi:hypothetical protein
MSECTREVFEFTAILAQLSVTAESTSLVVKQWRGGNIFYQVSSRERKKRGEVFYISSASEPMGHLKPTPDAEAMAKPKSLACRSAEGCKPWLKYIIWYYTPHKLTYQYKLLNTTSKHCSQATHLYSEEYRFRHSNSSLGEVIYLIFYSRI